MRGAIPPLPIRLHGVVVKLSRGYFIIIIFFFFFFFFFFIAYVFG
jgi:hypothetical protein